MNTTSAEKLEIKPVTKSCDNTVELKKSSNANATTAEMALCKDGVCTLNWKPRRPNTAA